MSVGEWRAPGAHLLGSHSWAMILRGAIGILFGVVLLTRPVISLGALVMVFGAFALVLGVLAVGAAIAGIGAYKYWWALLIEGLAGIVVGFLAFFVPGFTALALLVLVAVWAIVTGIFQVVGAISSYGQASSRWLQVLAGVISVALGVFLIVYPGLGIISLVWAVGIYAIVLGIDQIILGVHLGNIARRTRPQT